MKTLSAAWHLLRDTFTGFIDDEALSWGASIAYYTLFSIAPVLLVVVAIAGLVFGREAAEGAIVDQFSVMMGHQTAEALQGMVESAAKPHEGTLATIIGVIVLFIAVSGVFGEVQSAMNAIWQAEPPKASVLTRLARGRLVSMGLVVTAGFLLTVSLAASAALASFSTYLSIVFPALQAVLAVVDVVLSALLICGLFAAMFKVLPDVDIAWRDVAIGALASTILFEAGKYAIAFYVGQSNVASSYGAAGALIVLLVWIYYSAQIFLLGAEFSRAYAKRYGSHANP
jgi:membrane protein